MKRYLFLLLFIALCSSGGYAANDSLFVTVKDGRAMVLHEVRKNENLYGIAQLYSVPALVLSQNNDISFYDALAPGRSLLVPMGAYNYLKIKPQPGTPARPLYYRSQARDTYAGLSAALDVPEDVLRSWNKGNELHQSASGILFMGWVIRQPDDAPANNDKIMPEPVGAVAPMQLAPSPKNDTIKKGPPTELEMVFNYQTTNGQYLDSLSGMVVFFKPQTTVKKDMLYAFSNDIGRGRVIKVVNPSNNKFVYAKIIGPLPATKQYLNAKIGIDGRARAELETREIKLWCDLFFKY